MNMQATARREVHTEQPPQSDRHGPAPRGRERPAPAYVEASLTYLVETGEKPVIYSAASTSGPPRRTTEHMRHTVPVHDARPLLGRLSLDRQGFELRRHDTAVSDFYYDEEELRAVYDREVERVVKDATGASSVLIFDRTIRVDAGAQRGGNGAREPVRVVHNDYTARSGPQRVRDLLGAQEAERRLRERFAVVNVWRPIREPVEAAPLALADARSVRSRDLVPVDLVYPERTGEIYEVAFNPAHRWFYVPGMRRNEALLIKSYDSAADGRARFTPHTAFDDPTSPPGAAVRESIEARSLAFFGPENASKG